MGRKTPSQLETTAVSPPFSLIHSSIWTESEWRAGRSAFIGLKIGWRRPLWDGQRAISHLRGQVARQVRVAALSTAARVRSGECWPS